MEAFYIPDVDMNSVQAATIWIKDNISVRDVEIRCSLTLSEIVAEYIKLSGCYKYQRRFLDSLFIVDAEKPHQMGPCGAGFALWKALDAHLEVRTPPPESCAPKRPRTWGGFKSSKTQPNGQPEKSIPCLIPLFRFIPRKPEPTKPFMPCLYPETCGSKLCKEFIKNNPEWPLRVKGNRPPPQRVLPLPATIAVKDFALLATIAEETYPLPDMSDEDFEPLPLKRSWPLLDVGRKDKEC